LKLFHEWKRHFIYEKKSSDGLDTLLRKKKNPTGLAPWSFANQKTKRLDIFVTLNDQS